MLTIYGRRSAYNVQKVLWLVGELGQPHQVIEKGGEFGGLDDPDFLTLNPNGRVPVLVDGDTVVWESHSILRYLAAQYGGEGWWPADPAMRSLADRWLDWTRSNLEEDFLEGVFWGWYRTPPEQRDDAAVESALDRCDADLRLLEATIGDNPFFLGNVPTLADIVLGVNFYRYFNIDITRPVGARVTAWYERLTGRQAYRAAVMLPFDHMKGRLSF